MFGRVCVGILLCARIVAPHPLSNCWLCHGAVEGASDTICRSYAKLMILTDDTCSDVWSDPAVCCDCKYNDLRVRCEESADKYEFFLKDTSYNDADYLWAMITTLSDDAIAEALWLSQSDT